MSKSYELLKFDKQDDVPDSIRIEPNDYFYLYVVGEGCVEGCEFLLARYTSLFEEDPVEFMMTAKEWFKARRYPIVEVVVNENMKFFKRLFLNRVVRRLNEEY